MLVGLLVGGIAYFATNHGKALLLTLEQPTLTISNITCQRINGQFAVKLRNHTPIYLAIDSVRYVARVEGKQLAQGHQAHPLAVQGNTTSSLGLPLVLNLPQLAHEAKTAQRDCVKVQRHTMLYADLPGIGSKQILVDVRKRVYIPKLSKIAVASVDIIKLGLKKKRSHRHPARDQLRAHSFHRETDKLPLPSRG